MRTLLIMQIIDAKARSHTAAVIYLALVMLACGVSCGGPAATMPPSSPSSLLDRPVPAFRRPTIQGGWFDTSAVAGQVMVVELFAQYCRPCQRRLPAAERLRASLPDVAFVGISLDETPAQAQAQVRRYRLGFPVVHDAGHVLAGRLRVAELPVALVVGREGHVCWVGGPGQPDDALRQAVLAVRERGCERVAPGP